MSRTEVVDDSAHRVITEDVVSPYWDIFEEREHRKRHRLFVVAWGGSGNEGFSACCINGKHALISVVQVSISRKQCSGTESAVEMNLIVDLVLPVAQVKAHMVAWKGYVAHAVLPGEEPEIGTIRKCRKLEHCPSNTVFPMTPPLSSAPACVS